ncbi:hypothetical protein BDQ12DRAFT_718362 [Crucibulum laeve]|uniref:Uncharacterized protein n=1 Tax=Crucibulum laeve TaxID=68775 RepID=A0A5C3MEM0_9AGAR|nr:hypothetical protein BDQ12DRAFT_718362 [Crucibulum laeve]
MPAISNQSRNIALPTVSQTSTRNVAPSGSSYPFASASNPHNSAPDRHGVSVWFPIIIVVIIIFLVPVCYIIHIWLKKEKTECEEKVSQVIVLNDDGEEEFFEKIEPPPPLRLPSPILPPPYTLSNIDMTAWKASVNPSSIHILTLPRAVVMSEKFQGIRKEITNAHNAPKTSVNRPGTPYLHHIEIIEDAEKVTRKVSLNSRPLPPHSSNSSHPYGLRGTPYPIAPPSAPPNHPEPARTRLPRTPYPHQFQFRGPTCDYPVNPCENDGNFPTIVPWHYPQCQEERNVGFGLTNIFSPIYMYDSGYAMMKYMAHEDGLSRHPVGAPF